MKKNFLTRFILVIGIIASSQSVITSPAQAAELNSALPALPGVQITLDCQTGISTVDSGTVDITDPRSIVLTVAPTSFVRIVVKDSYASNYCSTLSTTATMRGTITPNFTDATSSNFNSGSAIRESQSYPGSLSFFNQNVDFDYFPANLDQSSQSEFSISANRSGLRTTSFSVNVSAVTSVSQISTIAYTPSAVVKNEFYDFVITNINDVVSQNNDVYTMTPVFCTVQVLPTGTNSGVGNSGSSSNPYWRAQTGLQALSATVLNNPYVYTLKIYEGINCKDLADNPDYPFVSATRTEYLTADDIPASPGAPTSTSAIAGSLEATVSWVAPTTGGAPTSYTVTSTPGSFTCTVNAPATSCIVTGLTNGTPYTFVVAATNQHGTTSSVATNAVTPMLYTISYHINNADSGTEPISETVTANSLYTVAFNSGNLRRTGFSFLGWSTDPSDGNNGTILKQGTDTVTVSSDVTLYAKWNNPYGFGLYLDKPFVQNSYIYDPVDPTTALESAETHTVATSCPNSLAIGIVTGNAACSVLVEGIYGGASTTTSSPTVGNSVQGSQYFGIGGGLKSSGNQTVTITFSQAQAYFGLWWSGSSPTDTLRFYNGDKLLATMTTSNLMTRLQKNNSTDYSTNTIVAPNGDQYPKGYYYGNPRVYTSTSPTSFPSGSTETAGGNPLTITAPFIYAYIHAFGSGGVTFDKVTLSGSTTGGFELDNLVTSSVAQTPATYLVQDQFVSGSNYVTFDRNESTTGANMAPQTSVNPTALTTNTYTRDGFTFSGWNTKADGSGRTLENNAQFSFDSDLTLYAIWTASGPTISSVSSNSGSTLGGTTITITGTNFVSGATVNVGGNACTNVVVVSATSITCTTPAGTAGPADIVVTNSDTGTVTSMGGFTYIAPPTIASISPLIGPTLGGTLITITGTNFVEGATVTVGGNPCTIVSIASTSITCTTPAGSVGAKNVVVTNPVTGTVTSTDGFTYETPVSNPLPLPAQTSSITSCQVPTGPTSGGNSYSIAGSFTTPITNIEVGGIVLARSAWVQTATSVTITMPANAAGSVAVRILNGQSPTLSACNYTYVAAGSPNPTGSTSIADKPLASTLKLKVFFALGSSAITNPEKRKLKSLVEKIKGLGNKITINVTGYAQPTPGSEKTDGALSRARAAVVTTYLRKAGVDTIVIYAGAGRATANVASSRYVEIVANNK